MDIKGYTALKNNTCDKRTSKILCFAAIALTSACMVQGARSLDEATMLSATDSAPVPAEMLVDVNEDFSKEYNVKDIFKLQQRMLNDSKIKKPISIDRFLAEMKKDARARPIFEFWTAAYASGSRQEGTESNPRVIMTTESGALTVTFTGDEELDKNNKMRKLINGDQLEMVQVDPVTYEKAFYQMYFPIGFGRNDKTPPKNPSLCVGCHSHTKAKSLVHIWGRYPDWPGILGSGEDFVSNQTGTFERQIDCPDNPQKFESTSTTTNEYQIIQNLRYKIENHYPRYRHLFVPEGAPPEYPFSNIPRGYFKNRPNFRMGGLWHRHHIKNIVWEAKQADYKKMKNLFLYGFFGCSEVVPDNSQMAMMAAYANEYQANKRYADKANSLINKMRTSTYNSIVWMNAGLEIAGVTLHGLTINDQSMSKFAYKSGYFPGGDKSDRLLARLLVEDDLKSSKTIPHDAYQMVKTPICNEKMGLDNYRYLRKFGYRPELKPGPDSQRMCGQILNNLGVKAEVNAPGEMKNSNVDAKKKAEL